MNFNWDEFLNQDNKIAVHCKTEEEANDFCRKMDKHGLTWYEGSSYLENTRFSAKGSETCYSNKGLFCDKAYYQHEKIKIYEWSDYMNNEFTKSDLRSGDVVVERRGDVAIVCVETGALIYQDGWSDFAKICEDLTDENESKYDIMKVYRPQHPSQCQFCGCYKDGELVYDRDTIEKERSERCKEIEELEKSFNEIAKLHNCTVKVKEAEEKRE